jgi:hypothetical protein
MLGMRKERSERMRILILLGSRISSNIALISFLKKLNELIFVFFNKNSFEKVLFLLKQLEFRLIAFLHDKSKTFLIFSSHVQNHFQIFKNSNSNFEMFI